MLLLTFSCKSLFFPLIKKINRIPLSNTPISQRIQDMSENVEQTIISRNKDSKSLLFMLTKIKMSLKFSNLLHIDRTQRI